jgi:cell division protein FtsB
MRRRSSASSSESSGENKTEKEVKVTSGRVAMSLGITGVMMSLCVSCWFAVLGVAWLASVYALENMELYKDVQRLEAREADLTLEITLLKDGLASVMRENALKEMELRRLSDGSEPDAGRERRMRVKGISRVLSSKSV